MKKDMIEICAWCKRIKKDNVYQPFDLEAVIELEKRTDITLTHDLCPLCKKEQQKELVKLEQELKKKKYMKKLNPPIKKVDEFKRKEVEP
ncbi:hypothetical protein KAW18_03880 [candidate division WOR-3 bacterium]|nr:hypothetical protein [candidate division WOR-3 bacterium]